MYNLEDSISNISNNHYHYLISLQNVNGVGMSYKYINQKNTFEPCLCVLVENKVNSKFLPSNNIIPKKYMGIKTDVIAIGKVSIENDIPTKIPFKFRPLEIGCSISLKAISSISGTMCCIVKKTKRKFFSTTTSYYILSSNHVLANSNKSPIGSLVMQPGYSQNGIFPVDVVAYLDDFIEINFEKENVKSKNLVDAGIAEIINPSIISNRIYSSSNHQETIKGVFKKLTTKNLLMPVKKIGYKTGLTWGNIRLINTTITVDFLSGKFAIFKKQIVSEIKTAPGDSGSAILTKDNEIIAMHMSGNNGFSFANNINLVFKNLNVKLYKG